MIPLSVMVLLLTIEQSVNKGSSVQIMVNSAQVWVVPNLGMVVPPSTLSYSFSRLLHNALR